MHTVGSFEFESSAEAREAYESVGPAAQTVVREVAKAMSFDRAEYDDRVTGDVVETARDALFASLLSVAVGSREAYEKWRDEYEGEVTEIGNENVDNVVWHAGPEGRPSLRPSRTRRRRRSRRCAGRRSAESTANWSDAERCRGGIAGLLADRPALTDTVRDGSL